MRPLEGVRIVEVSSWMASTSAGVILADMGADVVKVEPLGGDPLRGFARQARVDDEQRPAVDEPFQVDNRGKRSIAVDLTSDAGQEIVHRLVETADVFVCNLLPQRQQRYRLTPDDLLAVKADLVHATLTGYGTTGPDAWRPGYDVTAFFGRASISDGLVEPPGPPPQPRPAQGDHTTGLAFVVAILAGMRVAERTGQGQAVETSLFHTAAWTLATELAPTLVDHYQPSRRDRRHLFTPLANRFRCQDDKWVVLNMPEPHWWPRFCEAIDHKEWVDDPRFDSPRGRFDHMPELMDLLDDVFDLRDRDEWGSIFDEHGLIWGPIQSVVELVDDPQARAAGLWTHIDHPEVGRFDTVAVPMLFSASEVRPQGPAPSLGQHTDELLAAAGYDEAAVTRLRAEGVVA
jgi:crotonobetainyl-CoA:carnitine CoA-transferase CaiB-like acyl-CoA transferase